MRVAAHSAVWGSFVDSPSAVRRLIVSSAFRVRSAQTRCNGSSKGNGLPATGPPPRANVSGTRNDSDAGPASAGSDGDAIAPSAISLKIESPPPGRVPGVSPESHPAGSDWARRRVEVYRGRRLSLRGFHTELRPAEARYRRGRATVAAWRHDRTAVDPAES